LFNYGKLVQSHFENDPDYPNYLAVLIQDGSGVPTADAIQLVHSDDLYSEPNPVRFMVMVNQKLKSQSGRFFIDD